MSTAKKASAASAKKQAVADDNLKKFYLELAHRLCSPPENPDSENAWLWKLHATSQRLSRLFTTLNEHAAFDQVTAIHRACGYFLMKNDVPQKERRQVIEEELIRRIREIRRLASPAEENAPAGEQAETEAEADPVSDSGKQPAGKKDLDKV